MHAPVEHLFYRFYKSYVTFRNSQIMLPLTLYGSYTCEDTALVCDRLRALGVPFLRYYREDEPRVNDLIARWNKGNLVTPTLVFGDEAIILAEPTLEELESALRAAGYAFQPPRAVEIRNERRNQRAPNFTLTATNGKQVTLYRLPGRKRGVIFFAHPPDERICQGYMRQLTRLRAAFDEYHALPLLVVPAALEDAQRWAHEFARGYPALADSAGRVKQQYANYLNVDAGMVFLVILDSYSAVRAISFAPESGGLIAPYEIAAWLRLLDCECDE